MHWSIVFAYGLFITTGSFALVFIVGIFQSEITPYIADPEKCCYDGNPLHDLIATTFAQFVMLICAIAASICTYWTYKCPFEDWTWDIFRSIIIIAYVYVVAFILVLITCKKFL